MATSITPDAKFVFVQGTPQATWNIVHPLDKFPSVSIVDSNGDEVDGECVYISKQLITLTFSGAFSGKAFLN